VANLVGEIVSEAVTNAVVHAGATAVLVELDINDQLLRLSVSNEGELPDGYSPGLGLRLLDESTLSWGISNQGGRTVLTAELPLTSAATPLA
jgi:anti-sigma regulatory factor (Ser/Thr protein kinase)